MLLDDFILMARYGDNTKMENMKNRKLRWLKANKTTTIKVFTVWDGNKEEVKTIIVLLYGMETKKK